MKADIPETYFSIKDKNDEFAYQSLAALMSGRTESPLAHQHIGHNFGSQLEAFQNAISPNIARMHINQHSSISQIRNTLLSPNIQQQRNSVSPAITSGYNSAHNSFNNSGSSSIDQHTPINLFQQAQNPFLDRDTLLAETSALFDDEKTPTLLDVKVCIYTFC